MIGLAGTLSVTPFVGEESVEEVDMTTSQWCRGSRAQGRQALSTWATVCGIARTSTSKRVTPTQMARERAKRSRAWGNDWWTRAWGGTTRVSEERGRTWSDVWGSSGTHGGDRTREGRTQGSSGGHTQVAWGGCTQLWTGDMVEKLR
jgi:hypothetical protein